MDSLIDLWLVAPASRQLARELTRAGYYSLDNAIQVVTYWQTLGKTIAQIKAFYYIKG
jgi:hypothetical protein